MKGMHMGFFITLVETSWTTSSFTYDGHDAYMKSFPVADSSSEAGISDTVATMLSKMGVGKYKWKDMEELTCTTA
jgi:hypothetical protein